MSKTDFSRVCRVLGKKFYCLPDQSAPNLDVAAIEKRRCNAILAESCKFERALDAFAGVGVSARYWSRCARKLFLVENRPAALFLLRKNLPAIKRPSCHVHLVSATAGSFLEGAVSQGLKFDLVDCDPFGTCYDLLPLVAQVVPRGVVCVTSGEIFQVYRGLNRRPGRPPAHEFRGHRVTGWVVNILLPELMKSCGDARLVHFYAYPTSVRVILALGGFNVSARAFKNRPKLLGWLRSDRVAPVPEARSRDNQRSAD
jgi:hypothetical protein